MSPSRDGREPLTSVRDRVQASVVGRERELGLVLAAIAVSKVLSVSSGARLNSSM